MQAIFNFNGVHTLACYPKKNFCKILLGSTSWKSTTLDPLSPQRFKADFYRWNGVNPAGFSSCIGITLLAMLFIAKQWSVKECLQPGSIPVVNFAP